jgi:hypothetical protein
VDQPERAEGGVMSCTPEEREAIRAEAVAEWQEKLAALAAIEDYIGESGENAARNMRDLIEGKGDDDNDPRVQARRWGLEF